MDFALNATINRKIEETRDKDSKEYDKLTWMQASHGGYICYTRQSQVPYYRYPTPLNRM